MAIIPDNAVRSVIDGKLTFLYQWPQGTIAEVRSTYACICFKEKSSPAIVTCSGSMPKPELQCDGFIKVARRGDDYQPYQVNRQMALSPMQAVALKPVIAAQKYNLALDLKPDKQGEMKIHKLYIDDVPLDQYLRQNPTSVP